jgi:hypothetical protein
MRAGTVSAENLVGTDPHGEVQVAGSQGVACCGMRAPLQAAGTARSQLPVGVDAAFMGISRTYGRADLVRVRQQVLQRVGGDRGGGAGVTGPVRPDPSADHRRGPAEFSGARRRPGPAWGIWFGTQGGLARYDGIKMRVYRPIEKDPTLISSGYINALALDANGNRWVGTAEHGGNRYDAGTDRFTRFTHSRRSGARPRRRPGAAAGRCPIAAAALAAAGCRHKAPGLMAVVGAHDLDVGLEVVGRPRSGPGPDGGDAGRSRSIAAAPIAEGLDVQRGVGAGRAAQSAVAVLQAQPTNAIAAADQGGPVRGSPDTCGGGAAGAIGDRDVGR